MEEPRGPSLEGSTALVTGGSRGIGRAIARRLAHSGARVVIAARSRAELEATAVLLRREGAIVVPVVADVTNVGDIGRLVQTADEFGPVDILVNNAASIQTSGPLWESGPDSWWGDVRVLLENPFRCIHAVVPGMLARQRGVIINIVSEAGTGPSPLLPAYSVGKTALIRLTEILALQLDGTGLSAFAVNPGFVHTAMVEQTAQDLWAGAQFREWLAHGYAMPPEGAADLVFALATGAWDRLSGCYLSVGDDLAALVRRLDEAEGLRTLRVRR